jgi:iron complex outermembrane receptor protein
LSVAFVLGLRTFGVAVADDPTVTLPATVVKALRIETPPTSASATVEALDAADIASRNPQSLADAVEGLAGLRVQRYGGFGSLQSLSLHGATGEHVVVVRDGVRLNSSQHGLTDLSLYDANELGRLEVASGGYSAFYGADAMGGVVYVESQPVSELPRASLRTTTGSFGLRGVDVGARLTTPVGDVYAAFGRTLVANDYPYEWYGEPRTRWNSDAQQNTARLRAELPFASSKWTISAHGTRRHAGTPGADTGVVHRADEARIRQEDEDGYIAVRGVVPLSAWRLETTLDARGSYQRYDNIVIHVDSRHRTRSANASLKVERSLREVRFSGGVDGELSSIQSTDTSDGDRRRGGAFVLGVVPVAFGDDWNASLDIALREDVFSEFGNAFSPRVGTVVRHRGFRLFANASGNFRAPSFNSLYWRPGGNPDLRPERGIHNTVGSGWSSDGVAVEVSRLAGRYRNQIRWFPTATGEWSARNISRSMLESWQALLSVRAGRWRVRLDGSHTLTLQKDGSPETNASYGKHMPFMAKNMGSAEIAYDGGRTGISVRHRWVGKTYTRGDNREFLPAYAVTDAGVWVRFQAVGAEWETRFDVDNLWDRRYFVRPQYPLPGRAFRFGITGHV